MSAEASSSDSRARYQTPIVPLPAARSSSEGKGYTLAIGDPNYPSVEPLFHLPTFPDLERMPPPKELPKLPPPGYDMRTLRRQVDALQSELEQRIDGQADLYVQNERLWDYMDSLLDANRLNSERLKDHVGLLHRELFALHRERFRLATALKDARDSATILRELQGEHMTVGREAAEVDKLRLQAQRVLLRAQDENKALEDDLETQLQQMHSAHAMLEDLRSRRQEDQFDETADEFWWTSKSVLRSAYRRFRRGIAPRLRGRRTAAVMRRVFEKVEKGNAWNAWRAFIHRRRVMHRADIRRAKEVAVLCVAAWKTHVVLERHFALCFRRRALVATFRAWRDDVRDRHWEVATHKKLTQFKMKQRMRRAFGEWKSDVMFLGWNSPRTLLLCDDAHHLRKKHIFSRLRRRTDATHAHDEALSSHMLVLLAARPFRAWREVCRAKWRRRGNMLRRFFVHSRLALSNRVQTQTAYRSAIQFWLDSKLAAYFRSWHRLTRQRTRGHGSLGTGTTHMTTSRLTRHRQRRLTRAALQLLQARGVAGLRARGWQSASTRHHRQTRLTSAFHQLHTTARTRRYRRYTKSLALARDSFETWRAYVPQARREKQVLRLIERKSNIRAARCKRRMLKEWFVVVRSDRCLRRASQCVSLSREVHAVRRAMALWKAVWCKEILYRSRATATEVAQAAALADIKRTQLLELQSERDALASTAEHYQKQLADREARLTEREAMVKDMEVAASQQRSTISDLEVQVEAMQAALANARDEQERMRKIENAYFETRQKEEAAINRRKEEANALLEAMARDSARLRDEVYDAQSQAQAAGDMAAEEERKENALLQQALADAREAEEALSLRRSELSTQERTNISVESQVAGLKERLSRLGDHADGLSDEQGRELRNSQASVQVAASTASGFEAKEAELEALLADRRLELGRMHLSEVQVDEDREIREIASITQRVLSRTPGGYSASLSASAAKIPPASPALDDHGDLGNLSGFSRSGLDMDLGGSFGPDTPLEGTRERGTSEARNLLNSITSRLSRRAETTSTQAEAQAKTTSFDIDLSDGDDDPYLGTDAEAEAASAIALQSPDSTYRDARRRVAELTDKYSSKRF